MCVRDGAGSAAERCVYSRTIENDDITFGNGQTLGGITNPLEFAGTSQVKKQTTKLYHLHGSIVTVMIFPYFLLYL